MKKLPIENYKFQSKLPAGARPLTAPWGAYIVPPRQIEALDLPPGVRRLIVDAAPVLRVPVFSGFSRVTRVMFDISALDAPGPDAMRLSAWYEQPRSLLPKILCAAKALGLSVPRKGDVLPDGSVISGRGNGASALGYANTPVMEFYQTAVEKAGLWAVSGLAALVASRVSPDDLPYLRMTRAYLLRRAALVDSLVMRNGYTPQTELKQSVLPWDCAYLRVTDKTEAAALPTLAGPWLSLLGEAHLSQSEQEQASAHAQELREALQG